MKTEAALLVETGKPLVVVSVQTPPLKSGQVLVGIAEKSSKNVAAKTVSETTNVRNVAKNTCLFI